MARFLVVLLIAIVLAPPQSAASDLSRSPATAFSDAELIDGFVRTVFGAEDPSGRNIEGRKRIKKFIGPVRIHIINLARSDRSPEVRGFLRSLSNLVRNLKITLTNDENRAGMIIFLVDRADYRDVIRETMPESFNTAFLEESDCSAVTGGSKGHRLDRAFVYLVVDEGRTNFAHCMVEEITQSLGPINDDRRLKYSIFNDFSNIRSFGVFDWFILNMLYDRRIHPGMTIPEARAALPAVIKDARRRLSSLTAARRSRP